MENAANFTKNATRTGPPVAIAKKPSAAQALLVPFTVVVVPVEHIFVNNVCQLRTVTRS